MNTSGQCISPREEGSNPVRLINAILDDVPAFLDALRVSTFPHRYRYFMESPRPWCMYATVTGVTLEHTLGLTTGWSKEQCAQAISAVTDCQEPSGFFTCPVCRDDTRDERHRCSVDNRWGVSKKAFALYDRLEVSPPSPPPLVDPSQSGETVEQWIEAVFAHEGPYGGGSIVGHVIGLRNQALRARDCHPRNDEVFRNVYHWLDEHQNVRTGLFCAGDDTIGGVNGLLKMRYGVFQLADVPIPNPDRIVATILDLQRADGRFGASCGDFNAVTLLADLAREQPGYHRRIQRAFDRIIPPVAAKQNADGGFRWEPHETDPPNLIATSVNVQALTDIRRFLLDVS